MKFKADKEVQRYTVQARNDRFVIMTKPMNAHKTYLHTIADLKRKERGAIGLVFGLNYDVNNKEGAETLLAELASGEVEVSHRNCVPLSETELNQLETPKDGGK